MPGYLRIARTKFKVMDATLSARLKPRGPIEWFLNIEADEGTLYGEDCDPMAYIEGYPSAARSMTEFLAAPLVIKSGGKFGKNKILPDSRLCCLYVFEHEFLDNSQVRFKKDRGNRLQMVWTARCSVFGRPLPLKIEAPVPFLGFSVTAANKEEAEKLLAKKFEPRGFRFHQEPGEEGSYFIPVAGKW